MLRWSNGFAHSVVAACLFAAGIGLAWMPGCGDCPTAIPPAPGAYEVVAAGDPALVGASLVVDGEGRSRIFSFEYRDSGSLVRVEYGWPFEAE